MNAKCQFPSESKLGTGRQPFQRAARFVAAAKLGKFPAARNRITKPLSVCVYINVMMKTACATFSLQDNMPFPLPTENNTRNEAATPEQTKKPSKAWGNDWVKLSEVPKDCFSRETHIEYGDTWRNWLKTKLVPVFSIFSWELQGANIFLVAEILTLRAAIN